MPTSHLKGVGGEFIFKNLLLDKEEKENFSCPLLGEFQLENLLCATAAALALNYPLSAICQTLSCAKPIPGRLEAIEIPSHQGAPTVLVDYAHTPDALEKSTLTCKKALVPPGKLITVFGCGGDRDASKRPLMGEVAFTHSDYVVVTSDNPRTESPHKIMDDIFAKRVANEKWLHISDRKQAIEQALKLGSSADIVLIAGKGHEDYQIIGTAKSPFSDANVVKFFLENL